MYQYTLDEIREARQTHERRVARGKAAIEKWVDVAEYTDEDFESIVTDVAEFESIVSDLIVDVMHAATAYVHDAAGFIERMVEAAVMHFNEEQAEIEEVTPTAELNSTYVSVSGKTVEQWKVTGAVDFDEAVAAVPGDFVIHSQVLIDGVFYVDAIRHF